MTLTSRLFRGSHVPWLGIGIEYLRTNHLHLALQYIRQAQELCPQEPLVLHELGVLHYQQGEYEEAAHFFLQAALTLPLPLPLALPLTLYPLPGRGPPR